jgi:hypothetical protein
MSPDLVRLGGLAAMLDGMLWMANDLGGRLRHDPDDWDCNSSYDLVTNAIDSAAFLVLLAALALALPGYAHICWTSALQDPVCGLPRTPSF